jgi:hypothetical protein
MQQISDAFAVHYSTVGRTINQIKIKNKWLQDQHLILIPNISACTHSHLNLCYA